MKTFATALIFAVVVLVTDVVGNFCDRSWCENKREFPIHIACNNNGQFQPTCQDPQMVNIDQNLQNVIVSKINEKRNFIAGGGERGYNAACRMAAMQWDSELAKLAELNVKRCEIEHDCHNTRAYPYSGQNIGWSTYYGNPDYQSLITDTIEGWYDEIADCNMGVIKRFPQYYSGPFITHFTVMVADRNNRVGCAASTYFDTEYQTRKIQFTCNFAHTTMQTQAIYSDCYRAGEKCTTGKHNYYPNLCSPYEQYDH